MEGATQPETALQSVVLQDGGVSRPFFFRAQTSDAGTMQQIFVNADYHLGRLKRWSEIEAFLQGKRSRGGRPLIVDAGANIGAAAVFFSLRYPDASIVAIEPEESNFGLLQRNVEGLNVQCLKAALAASDAPVRLVDPGIGHWGFRTETAQEAEGIPGVTIGMIYEELRGSDLFPFIVKIDIEGGEKDVFEGDTGWVAQTPIIIIELHDWLLPKAGTARSFLRCVSSLERDFIYIGENIFSVDNVL